MVNQASINRATKTFAVMIAFVFSLFMGQAPVAHASSINFDKADTEVRGAIQYGTLATCQEKVYTPVSDSDGNLRVIHSGYQNDNLAQLPQHDNAHVAGAIVEVDVAHLNGCNFFVTATRDSSNTVKLISWFSGADGVDRLGDSGNHGMAATEVVMAGVHYPYDNQVDRGYVVVASRMNSGHLVMSVADVEGASIEWNVFEIDELASQISMVVMPPRPEDQGIYAARVVTAFKNAAGDLKLVLWSVDNWGGIQRVADSGNQAGNVQQIAIAQYDDNNVVTAVKNSDGNLQMIPWEINPESIQREHGEDDPAFNDPFAGSVQEIDIASVNISDPLFDHVVTAVRTADGNLRLIAWGIDYDGNVVRKGDSGNLAGAATKINLETGQANHRVITSLRDGDGNLRIIAWRILN